MEVIPIGQKDVKTHLYLVDPTVGVSIRSRSKEPSNGLVPLKALVEETAEQFIDALDKCETLLVNWDKGLFCEFAWRPLIDTLVLGNSLASLSGSAFSSMASKGGKRLSMTLLNVEETFWILKHCET